MFLDKVLKKKTDLLNLENINLKISDLYSLKNISFNIHNLDFVCIGGDENCDFLMKIMAGFISPDSGKISFNKTPLFGGVNLTQIYRHFSYVDNNNTLYGHLTILEYLEYFGTLHDMQGHILDKNISKLLKMVEVGKYKNMKVCDLPLTLIKKANILCSLINNPKILFVNNFTNDLDHESRKEIFSLLKKLKNHGMTVIVSDMDYEPFSKLFDHLIIIQRGKLTYDSKNKKGDFKMLYKITFKSDPGDYGNFLKVLEDHKQISSVQIIGDKCILSLKDDANLMLGLSRLLKDYSEKLISFNYEKIEVKNE